MIRLPDVSPCSDCDNFIGVKQPHGNESVEFFFCTKYKKITVEQLNGKDCEHQTKEE